MRGFCFLLATGQISPWHKTRDLVDSTRYRTIWDTVGPIVAIIRAREKPEWLQRLWNIPYDGQWHPCEIEPGQWQGLRAVRDGDKTTYHYDVIERVVGEGYRERAANRLGTRNACELRCALLNNGRGSFVVDMRNSFERPLKIDHPDLIVIDDPWCEFSKYGSASDEFPA